LTVDLDIATDSVDLGDTIPNSSDVIKSDTAEVHTVADLSYPTKKVKVVSQHSAKWLAGPRLSNANVPDDIVSSLGILADTKAIHDTKVHKKGGSVNTSTDKDHATPHEYGYLWNGKEIYLQTAKAMNITTDKVTTHEYQIMYGQFLLPYYHQNPKMKMLEIGLGCDMNYGPGASVAIYQKLFPEADLWEAEYDEACVEKGHKTGSLDGIKTVTGDQGNVTVLDRWLNETGGDFDVIIDDGGHQNCQIWTSFLKLWPAVKPGGLYFIEDMQVAKSKGYMKYDNNVCDKSINVPDKLKQFIDKMIYGMPGKYDIDFIFCQSQACVLGKR